MPGRVWRRHTYFRSATLRMRDPRHIWRTVRTSRRPVVNSTNTLCCLATPFRKGYCWTLQALESTLIFLSSVRALCISMASRSSSLSRTIYPVATWLPHRDSFWVQRNLFVDPETEKREQHRRAARQKRPSFTTPRTTRNRVCNFGADVAGFSGEVHVRSTTALMVHCALTRLRQRAHWCMLYAHLVRPRGTAEASARIQDQDCGNRAIAERSPQVQSIHLDTSQNQRDAA